MKEQWKFSKENLVALEVGSIRDEENPHRKSAESSGRNQLIQYVKIILYFELILFIMWASYTLWQTYPVNPNHINTTNNVQQPKSHSLVGQNWIYEKNKNSFEKLYEPEDILIDTKNFSQEYSVRSKENSNNDESEYLNKEITVVNTTENSDTEINEEHDLIFPTTNDNEFTSETTESSTVSKDYNISNATENPVPIQFENTSEVNASFNSSNDSSSEEGFDDESKAEETLKISDDIADEERKEILENYIFFLLMLQNAMKNVETSDDFIKNNNKEKADFEVYGEWYSDESIDDSSVVPQQKSLTEMDNVEGISEDKLISLENSNVYKDTVISQSAPEGTDEMKQAETFTDSDEYPETQESKDDFHTSIPVEDYLNKDTIQSGRFDENKDNSKSSDSSQISSSMFEENDPNYFLGLQTPFLISKINKPIKYMATISYEGFDNGKEWIRRLEKRSDNSATTANKDSTRTYTENKEEKSDDHLMPQFLKKKIQNDIGDR
ncbi:hypothetical protein ANTRET_LOCUS7725 [Anthophora retusa]